ncbi:hypothetical protein BSKO_03721 [Bryopsis sp. KO-2023]|nr:hypothetical protein BSKO_03721 [Bryopsis sp. KO-2023]
MCGHQKSSEMASIFLDNCVDSLSGVTVGDRFLLAAGLSNFTGRWWTGEVSVLEPTRSGSEKAWTRGSGRLRCGVSGVDWLRNTGGAALVSGGDDGSVDVWEVVVDDSGDAIEVIHQENSVSHSSIVTSVASQPCAESETAKFIATSSLDGTAALWDVGQGGLQWVNSMKRSRAAVSRVRWCAWDNRCFSTASDDGEVRLWRVGERNPWGRFLVDTPAYDAVWLEENTLVVSDEAGSVRLFDARKPGEFVVRINLGDDSIRVLALSCKGVLAAGSDSGEVFLVDGIQGNAPAVNSILPSMHGAYVRGLAWDGPSNLYRGGWDGGVTKLEIDGIQSR